MDKDVFQQKLTDLIQAIGNVSPEDNQRLKAITEQAKKRHESLKRAVGSLQDSLDYLRLSVKYLLFDLEATRRENGELRKRLEDRSSG
jgi:hypothetical protein